MKLIDVFKKVFRGERLLPEKEEGPIPGSPDLQEDDINFILKEHTLRKWADVEYYGPGAEEAEKRRAASLGRILGTSRLPEEETKAEKKRRRRTEKKENKERIKALIEKRNRMRKEAKDLERQKPK